MFLLHCEAYSVFALTLYLLQEIHSRSQQLQKRRKKNPKRKIVKGLKRLAPRSLGGT